MHLLLRRIRGTHRVALTWGAGWEAVTLVRSRTHAALALLLLLPSCAIRTTAGGLADFAPSGSSGERIRVLELYPGVTATLVAPARLDPSQRVDLILYALPNGNSTAETMGRRMEDSTGWRFDIQHIAAQTRALRTMGYPQAIVAYLEADTKSWPEWRRLRGYERANARIVGLVEQLRAAIGDPPHLSVTLTGHSGGGSFMFGFIEGRDSLPAWLERIAFLDANYNFAPPHGDKLVAWLKADLRHQLVVLAYDDREIMLDGKKVVSDSGGTWRASWRMLDYLRGTGAVSLAEDTLGAFRRFRAPQVDILLHPNPGNRILHTEMIGEMNGYMHALLDGRPDYQRRSSILVPLRAYGPWVDDGVTLPAATPPAIPPHRAGMLSGTAFIASVAGLSHEEREVAIRRQLLAGNVPSFLRAMRSVEVTADGPDGIRHSIRYEVMPDYLAIGSDEDFVRMPMTPYTAQAFCDAFGYVLPTRKMVNDIWAAAPVHLDPRPLTEERESPMTFLQHHRIIEGQLAGVARGAFVAGIKKDVVVTNRLQERPDRVAIFGWHYPGGQPIQPLYVGHVDWYVDYSHGIRPVRRWMLVDGVRRPFDQILVDSLVLDLLSDEGPIVSARYEK